MTFDPSCKQFIVFTTKKSVSFATGMAVIAKFWSHSLIVFRPAIILVAKVHIIYTKATRLFSET